MENPVKSINAKAWFARMVEPIDATGGTSLKVMITLYLIHAYVKMDSLGNIVKLSHQLKGTLPRSLLPTKSLLLNQLPKI